MERLSERRPVDSTRRPVDSTRRPVDYRDDQSYATMGRDLAQRLSNKDHRYRPLSALPEERWVDQDDSMADYPHRTILYDVPLLNRHPLLKRREKLIIDDDQRQHDDEVMSREIWMLQKRRLENFEGLNGSYTRRRDPLHSGPTGYRELKYPNSRPRNSRPCSVDGDSRMSFAARARPLLDDRRLFVDITGSVFEDRSERRNDPSRYSSRPTDYYPYEKSYKSKVLFYDD